MSSYAIIEAGGKQLRVEPGRFYDVDRLAAEPDSKLTIDKVLFVRDDDTVSVGQPFISGATVQATVVSHLRGPKLIVYKMKPKKKTRKKQGHRQELTRLMIDSIDLAGQASSAAQKSAANATKPEAGEVAEADEEA